MYEHVTSFGFWTIAPPRNGMREPRLHSPGLPTASASGIRSPVSRLLPKWDPLHLTMRELFLLLNFGFSGGLERKWGDTVAS